MAIRSDADLVRVFVDAHGEAAEAAFEALVARHGPMVLGVCRRMLRDDHAAEDAFQAVFLVLARRAGSVRVDDSLGRWLHGVTRRVAARARNWHAREVVPSSARREGGGDPASEVARDEVRRLIALEVASLPRKYREVVALCHIDGLGHDATAEALGIPVGTVRSRLSRARDYLRPRLARRGLAPSSFAAWVGRQPTAIDVSRGLLETTLANAGRVAIGAASPTVLVLFERTMRSYAMVKMLKAGTLAAALGTLTAGALVLARGGDEPSETAAQAAQVPEPKKEVAAPTPSLEDQFRRITREYEEAKDRVGQVASKAKTDFERWKVYSAQQVDEAGYARRIVDLAAAHPKELASRDYLIWVMYQPHRADAGAYGDEFARAARLLVMHHADDPEVARVGLGFENVLTRHRDAFLEGIYANAEGREARGLARMALARYLAVKARSVTGSRTHTQRGYMRSRGYDDQGNVIEKMTPYSHEDEGYRVYARMLDADYVRAESERLFEEVIADYADVPYITTAYRKMERMARETPSSTIADPEKKQRMVETEEYLAKNKFPTLGKIAAGRLDDMRNLSVGKVAPEFEGLGADGKPIKLSDYKGKVVVLAYWFSTCGPCLAAIPDELKLAEKMKGRPFTLLGVVTDGRADDARKVIESEKMTWPNVVVGGEKVAERYHITGNPSYFVLDAAGVIRAKGYLLASDMDQLAEKLVAEAEEGAKTKPRP
jgi:RNA polymerase sigma factor (sigma-70 family)